MYADLESVNVSVADWVPTAPRTRTTALLCTGAGLAYVDMLGAQTGQTGAVNFAVSFAVNQIIELAVLKVHKTGTTGTFIALY